MANANHDVGMFFVPNHVAKAQSDSNKLRVGMEVANAPYNWLQTTDANDAVKVVGTEEYAIGYDVEIAKRVAKAMGKELEIVKIEWDGLLPALLFGEIDAIIAGMSPTPSRKEVIDFSNLYYVTKLSLVTKVDVKYANAQTLADFSGARITGALNTVSDTVIDQMPGVNHLTPLTDNPALQVAAESGKLDAYVVESPIALAANYQILR